MSQPIIGMDPSLTGFAICEIHGNDPEIRLLTSEPALGVHSRINRFSGLATQALEAIPHFCMVFIETYGWSSRGDAVTSLAEMGGILRFALIGAGHQIVEVTPNLIKKFATGKGSGDKGFVQAHVAKRWGMIFKTNDETDAYVLARIGRCYQDESLCETDWQREVIAKLKAVPVKKSRKKKAVGC